MRYIGMSPAYGRDYKSKADVLQAVREGKDFSINDYGPDMGRAANMESFVEQAPVCLKIRYKKNTQVTVIELKRDGSADFQKGPR